MVDRESLRKQVAEARQSMIFACESIRDSFNLSTLPLKRDAFMCGARCVDAAPTTISEFNQCVSGCQDKVTRVDNVARTYLDAVTDRVELCLLKCYGDTPKDPEAWEKLPMPEFTDKMACSNKCYLDEAAWIQRQHPRWKKRVDSVVSS